MKGKIDNTAIATSIAKVAGLDLKKATAALQSKHLYPKFKVSRDGKVLFPAVKLAQALQIKVTNDSTSKTTTFAKDKVTLKVKDGASVTLNGKAISIPAEVEHNVLYLSLDAFSKLTGKALKWDSLSERIILK